MEYRITSFVSRAQKRVVARALLSALSVFFSLQLRGAAPSLPDEGAALAARQEMVLIEEARRAAGRGDDAAVDAHLLSATGLASRMAPSVSLAQRAVTLCGWLRSDNEYGEAGRLAKRVISRLEVLRESKDLDRAERLYWEAWLAGETLAGC